MHKVRDLHGRYVIVTGADKYLEHSSNEDHETMICSVARRKTDHRGIPADTRDPRDLHGATSAVITTDTHATFTFAVGKCFEGNDHAYRCLETVVNAVSPGIRDGERWYDI
jgi:hypothetical protein